VFPCDVTQSRRGCRSQVAGRGFVGLLVARGFAIGRVVELHLTTVSNLLPKTELACICC